MTKSTYQKVYAIVRQIPPGKVASYGQIAKLVDRCTARMVGYAMHAIGPEDGDVPWQRVINSKGRISSHGTVSAPACSATCWKKKASYSA